MTEKEVEKNVVDLMEDSYLNDFRSIEQLLNQLSKKFGVGWRGLSLLTQISKGETKTLAGLSKRNQITKGAVSLQLTNLLKLGLIEITVNARDRRHHVISLTTKGSALSIQVNNAVSSLASRVTQEMTVTEIQQLHRSFGILAKVLTVVVKK